MTYNKKQQNKISALSALSIIPNELCTRQIQCNLRNIHPYVQNETKNINCSG